MVVIFILRGLFVLSIFPPFEGWDEYQHIAYIEYYLEHGEPPIFNDSTVPRSLYPDLVQYPHCAAGADQIRRVGALSYDQFWAAKEPPTVLPGAPSIGLYQAQHASLYYRIVAPIYGRLKSNAGILTAITVLRLINLGFGTAAVAIALMGLGRIMKPGAGRCLTGLLVATQPLFLMNCARIANDALAVLFGTIVIVVLLTPKRQRDIARWIIAGVALGLGTLAKTTTLGLAPFIVLATAYSVIRKQTTPKKGLLSCAIMIGLATIITYPYFSFNVRKFGMLSPMQEAVRNRKAGLGTGDLIRAATEINWLQLMQSRYLRHSLWSSGWSLHSPSWRTFGINRFEMKAHEFLLYAAGAGGLFLLSRRRREERRLFVESGAAPKLVLLWLGVTAALCIHALHTYLALPNIATNSWYAAVIFPWLLALVAQGYFALPYQRLAIVLGMGLLLVFVSTEVYGVMVDMVRTFTGESWGPLAKERLASIHVHAMGPSWTTPLLALALSGILLGTLTWIAIAIRSAAPAQTPDVKS